MTPDNTAPGGAANVDAVWSITFQDPRDFCRFASILIGAAYSYAPAAMKRFQDGSLFGESTWGKVSAALALPTPVVAAPETSQAMQQAAEPAVSDCKECGGMGFIDGRGDRCEGCVGTGLAADRAASPAPRATADFVMVPREPLSEDELKRLDFEAFRDAPEEATRWERKVVFARNIERALAASAPPAPSVVSEDARRYQLLRRGQHWSVIDWRGDDLRAESLDAAIDARLSAAGDAPEVAASQVGQGEKP